MSPRRLEQLVARLAAEPARWQSLVRHEHDARVYEQLPLLEQDANASIASYTPAPRPRSRCTPTRRRSCAWAHTPSAPTGSSSGAR